MVGEVSSRGRSVVGGGGGGKKWLGRSVVGGGGKVVGEVSSRGGVRVSLSQPTYRGRHPRDL